MVDFASIDLAGQVPAQICPECAAGGLHHQPTGTDLAHCWHAVTGAYRVSGRDWVLLRGVELHVFKELICRGLVMGGLRLDLARDLARLLEEQAKNATRN